MDEPLSDAQRRARDAVEELRRVLAAHNAGTLREAYPIREPTAADFITIRKPRAGSV